MKEGRKEKKIEEWDVEEEKITEKEKSLMSDRK